MNSQHPAPKAGALPIALHPDIEFYMWSPLWSGMWSNGGFLEKRETGKYGKSEASCAFAGFAFGLQAALRTRSQSRRATSCATPGRRQNALAPLLFPPPGFAHRRIVPHPLPHSSFPNQIRKGIWFGCHFGAHDFSTVSEKVQCLCFGALSVDSVSSRVVSLTCMTMRCDTIYYYRDRGAGYG